jgi:NAD-dependent deacetylase
MSESIVTAYSYVVAANRIVGLTGAGISTDSGIPNYRGPEGMWTKNPAAERMATLDAYLVSADVRRRAWQSRLTSPIWTAQPNVGHRAFVDLERQGKLDVLITQNIDGLHQLAGNDPARVIELHGTFREIMCLNCGRREPAGPTLERVRHGERDPACLECGGILKSATISFGQQLMREDLQRAERATIYCDLLLVVGTSLGVYPAAALVPLAVEHGAKVVIVNKERTPYDGIADVVVRKPISDALPAIVGSIDPRRLETDKTSS